MEILYPKDLIRRTYKAIRESIEPETIDDVVEQVDVRRAIDRLPDQYQRALVAWHETDGSQVGIAMALHSSEETARVTIRAAWDYLYKVLNG